MNIEQKVKTIAENMPKVYDSAYNKGFEKGIENGIAEGVERGKQAEYDRFWDNYQDYGNRTIYGYGFSNSYWNKETFKPKYTIYGGNYCFYTMNQTQPFNDSTAVDFTDIPLDTSNLKSATYMFANCNCKNITVDLSNCTSLLYTFILSGGGYLNNITLKVSEKLTTVTNPFANTWTLINLKFTDDSVITCNGFDFHWSTSLSKASIQSVINALSPTVSGLTVTFSLGAVKNAFETSSAVADGNTSEEWLNLIATKSNWTINLV